MQSTITATTKDGGQAVAWLHRATGKPDTCIVIIHGHNSDGDRGRFITLAKWFEHHSYDAARWNAIRPRLGEGERYRVLPLKEELAQLRAVLDKLKPYYKRIVLLGHSQGGLLALKLATEGYAHALVQLMSVVDTKENIVGKLRTVGCDIEALKKQGSAEVTYQNEKTFVYDASYFEDFITYDVPALYAAWHGPTLLVAGTRDEAIPRAEVDVGFGLANEPKELVIVDDVHNFSEETATMLAANIVAWLRRE